MNPDNNQKNSWTPFLRGCGAGGLSLLQFCLFPVLHPVKLQRFDQVQPGEFLE
jgi:hypothetical protein